MHQLLYFIEIHRNEVSDEPAEDGKYYKTYNTYDYDDPTYQLMQNAENYCAGWHHFTVDGKHYYTVNHA